MVSGLTYDMDWYVFDISADQQNDCGESDVSRV